MFEHRKFVNLKTSIKLYHSSQHKGKKYSEKKQISWLALNVWLECHRGIGSVKNDRIWVTDGVRLVLRDFFCKQGCIQLIRNCIHFWLDRRTKFIVNEIKRKKTVSPICRCPSIICEHKKMQPNQTTIGKKGKWNN